MRMGIWELILILLGIVFVFGPKQLPKVTAAVKESLQILYQTGKEGIESIDEKDLNE